MSRPEHSPLFPALRALGMSDLDVEIGTAVLPLNSHGTYAGSEIKSHHTHVGGRSLGV